MPWVRLDDTFDDDPRVVTAGFECLGLLVTLLCWNNRTLADGFVPQAVAKQKAGGDTNGRTLIERLITNGLLIRAEQNGTPGFRIAQDPIELQPSRAKVEADRRAAKTRKGLFNERRESARRTGGERRSAAFEDDDRTNTPTRPDPEPGQYPDPARARSDPAEYSHGRKDGKEGSGEPLDGNLENDRATEVQPTEATIVSVSDGLRRPTVSDWRSAGHGTVIDGQSDDPASRARAGADQLFKAQGRRVRPR